MRKIFIDCGAFDGCSIRLFREKRDPGYEYEIFSFEPPSNPLPGGFEGILAPSPLEKVAKEYRAKIIRKAVWVHDGEILFYGDINAGSTVIGDKMFATGCKVSESHRTTAYAVECIDLSKWIQETFDKEDHIELKMDIEGAEYEVIEKMHKDGTLGMINRFSGELHGTKVCKSRAETDKLLEYCADFGLKIYLWDAVGSENISNKYYNKKILDAEFDKWEKRYDKSSWGSLKRF